MKLQHRLPIDHFAFPIVTSLAEIEQAKLQKAREIHLHMPCGHHWVCELKLAEVRLETGFCPICLASAKVPNQLITQ
jgi:hypothetical protein